MRIEEIVFVGALAHRFQVLMPLIQEHVDTYDEVLPHLFLGDVTRWLIDQVCASSSISDRTIREMLDFFEEGFKEGGDKEKELISVSFLENFPRANERGSELRDLVGPELRRELEQIEK